ncbi:MAG: TIGR03790 family protein [Nitrospira sp.]|nr:TIGR03790 family protein [Nitrospira sp.]
MSPTIHRTSIWCLLLCACLLGDPSRGRAELQPDQVVILANAKSPESMAVASHYAARRGVPTTHIVLLDLPLHDNLTRQEYEESVVVPLRRTLEAKQLASTTRVIVTTYGIPLRIEAPRLSKDEKIWLAEAQSLVKASRTRLEQLQSAFEQVTPGSPKIESLPQNSTQEILEMARTMALLPRVDQAWRAAVQHVRQLPQPESGRAMQELFQLTLHYGGWGILLQKEAGVTRPGFSTDNQTMAAWRQLLEQTSPYWAGLGSEPIRSQRQLVYRWTERLFGLRGVLELASAEVDLLTYNYADASLDSELSLLWWDRDLYPAAWRWRNPLFQDSAAIPDDLPTLMVSRLDAPTADLAKGLVDKALEAERSGLQGTVYLDARGLKAKDATDTYGVYDQSLRDAAEVVKQQSEYRVVLDDAEATLSKPGAAPDVALYIGWYKLRSYEDAFTFKPGAIGYHMASAEAITVHGRGERGWCKNALERGITATLGSVGEPYLDAFPEPARFATLLLTGKYSLVEVYYLTSRYVSWRMVLFGDPLYNPMKGRSRPTADSAVSLPLPPSERPLGDLPARLAQKHQEQRDRMARLVKLLLSAEAGSARPAR